MTSKLTITDERLAELVAFKPLPGTDINSATRDEWMSMAAELQERRKAAMDSEPVAEVVSMFGDPEAFGEREIKLLVGIQNMPYGTKLYRHAQPGSVVDNEPYGFTDGDRRGMIYEPQYADRLNSPLPVYRHAQPAPDQMLCDFYEVNSWPDLVRELVKHVEQLQDSAKRNVKPWEDTFPETLLPAYIERVKQADGACRAAMLQAGNSPVIPDGYRLQPISEYEAMCATVNSDEWPQRWIPVSERMPEDRTQVILWDAEIGEVTSGHYSHKTHTFYHCGDAIQNEITHWMPLPAAPQEVKGES